MRNLAVRTCSSSAKYLLWWWAKRSLWWEVTKKRRRPPRLRRWRSFLNPSFPLRKPSEFSAATQKMAEVTLEAASLLLLQCIRPVHALSWLIYYLYTFMFLFYRMAGASGRKKVFRLSDVIQPLSESQIEKLTSTTIKRILNSEKAIAQSGMSHVSKPNNDMSIIKFWDFIMVYSELHCGKWVGTISEVKWALFTLKQHQKMQFFIIKPCDKTEFTNNVVVIWWNMERLLCKLVEECCLYLWIELLLVRQILTPKVPATWELVSWC